MRGVLVAIVALVAACGRGDAIELREWTLRHDGGEVRAVLPGQLALPAHAVRWTLETEVRIPDAWSGQPVTLTVPFYFGPELRVTVDGVAAVPLDDQAVACAFRLPASDAAVRTLVIEGRHAHFLDVNLPATLALSPTARGDARYRAVAAFERWSVVFALGVMAVVMFVYAASWLLDRRPAHRWLVVQGACGMYLVAAVYAVRAPLWPFVVHSMPLVIGVAMVAGAAFNHAHFGRGPLPRWLPALLPIGAALLVATVLEPFTMLWTGLGQVLVVVGVAYNLRFLGRYLRDPIHGPDARLFTCGWAATLVSASFDNLPALGVQLVPSVSFPTGMAIFALLQSYVVTRDRAARMREAERLNVELRRQVADRSRELAAALSGSAAASGPVAVGAVIEGRYEVVRALGAGAMGAVYEVVRLADGRRCALKVITLRASGDVLARFAREAEIAATLDAPNLVAVIDVGVSPAVGLYLVMELVTGGTLAQRRARFGDEVWARPLCAQLATGLAAMHEAGVLHRDLKPANVLLDGDIAKIADFGLAVPRPPARIDVEADTAAPALTEAGALLGTPAYMAPELARGAEHASPASDVFAWGVVAYELFTGRTPFAEPAVMLAARGAPLPAVTGVPAPIARALDGDPARRPTAAAIRDALADPR